MFRSKSSSSINEHEHLVQSEEIIAEGKAITGDDVVPGGKGYSKNTGGVFVNIFGSRKNPSAESINIDSDDEEAANSDDSSDAMLKGCNADDGIGIDAAPKVRGWGKQKASLEEPQYPELEYEISKPALPQLLQLDLPLAQTESGGNTADFTVENVSPKRSKSSSKSKSPRKKRRRPMEKMACIPELNEATPEIDTSDNSDSSEQEGSDEDASSQSTTSSSGSESEKTRFEC
mmetsp:Transcript_14873/g.21451  ORF Transcript_14873/g.21451 Transcript_14873/m.21451 type:complete len:232 (+) Transcript_14873:297-992(+)